MVVNISPSSVGGKIKAIASKSAAHRILICAAFAKGESRIRCEELNRDIEATARCLSALGADISYDAPFFRVRPIEKLNKGALLECGESGSTLRFMVPIVIALGADASFKQEGRLASRPLSPLRELLEENGGILSPQGTDPLVTGGRLTGDRFSIRGDVSSQFISGMLFALALLGKDASLTVTEKIESAPYIELTLDALSLFGVRFSFDPNTATYTLAGAQSLVSPGELDVEGDWSNAAFPLCMGAVGSSAVTLTGLKPDSHQGDKKILYLLRGFGAEVKISDNGDVTVGRSGKLRGQSIDASQIPDLVPVLAAVAAVSEGETHIYGAQRLKIKESDRLATVSAMLRSLGADVRELSDGLIINGSTSLSGGVTESFNDHRIAMSAAVASVASNGNVIIKDAEATNKSYPDFWRDAAELGLIINIDSK